MLKFSADISKVPGDPYNIAIHKYKQAGGGGGRRDCPSDIPTTYGSSYVSNCKVVLRTGFDGGQVWICGGQALRDEIDCCYRMVGSVCYDPDRAPNRRSLR